MTRHDELVEEIQDIWRAGKERRLPNVSPQQLIALVLKAVVDGMPLPGESERIDVDAYVGELLEWIEELPQHTELIALSPSGISCGTQGGEVELTRREARVALGLLCVNRMDYGKCKPGIEECDIIEEDNAVCSLCRRLATCVRDEPGAPND